MNAVARTQRDLVLCPLEVQAEVWVDGVGGAETHRAVYSAEVLIGRPVPSSGTWRAYGKHWSIWWGGASWTHVANTTKTTNVSGPPPSPQEECALAGGQWNYELGICDYLNCPIVMDVAGRGYQLTSVEDGVFFDLNADGVAERVAWTEPGSGNGWLVFDRNGNGVVDDGSELFGNYTPAYADQAEPTAIHGFEALKFTEGPSYGPSSANYRIGPDDAIFHRLMIWIDANHNGISEPTELTPLLEAGLLELSLDYRRSRRRDRHGNEYRLSAPSWWRHPETGLPVRRTVYDVWLRTTP